VPLVRYWLSVFKIPYSVLFPSILFFCCIGTYSVDNSLDDVFITATFGFIGYVFMRLDLDAGRSLALLAIAALIPWLPLPSKRQPRHGGDALFVLLSAATGTRLPQIPARAVSATPVNLSRGLFLTATKQGDQQCVHISRCGARRP